MIKKRLYFLIVLVLGVGLSSYWYHHHQKLRTRNNTFSHRVPVKLAPISVATIPKRIETVGSFAANRQLNISSQMAGKITAISFQSGNFVHSGDLLIQLDDQLAKSQYMEAKAAFDLAKISFQRYQALIHSGAFAKQALDQFQAQFIEAKAKLDEAQTILSQTQIRAPFSGYISAPKVEMGEYVQPGEPLATLTDRQILIVNYCLPEQYLSQLQLGQQVEVRPANIQGNNLLIGKVSYISPAVDVATHSICLHATVENSDNRYAPGLFVQLHQIVGKYNHVLLIPQTAVVSSLSGTIVYRVKNEKAEAVQIKILGEYQEKVIISGKLSVKDKVIVAGQSLLRDGAEIEEVAQK